MSSSAASVDAALAANRALEAQLRAVAATLADEERQLQQRMQAARQRLALRRAGRAVAALEMRSPATAAAAARGFAPDVFTKAPESRYKPVAPEPPRSFIRPKRSFFSDAAPSQPRKRGRKPKGFHEQLRVQRLEQQQQMQRGDDPSEPAPNADTRLLRRCAHEAFVAAPPSVFTPKERQLLREFAEAQLKQRRALDGGGGGDLSLPLATWNQLTTRGRAPIQRSGFECMLRWELHDKPGLRLCAWTKAEDAALRALASGETDPALVNRWEEIARRMPVPGRPAVHCLIRYQSKLCASIVSSSSSSFTPEEDALVLQAVGVFGERWNIIADLMDGRVPEQIRHRWQQTLSPQVKRGKFSVVEDRRMLLALYTYHDRATAFRKEVAAWTDVSHHVPGRAQAPLRDRFLNSLNSEISFTSWKPQDDAQLLRVVAELGWSCPGLWARVAEHFGNRSDNQVARRWKFLAPDAYEQYRAEKRAAAAAAALPAILHRRRKRTQAAEGDSRRLSSYNVLDDPESDAALSDSDDSDASDSDESEDVDLDNPPAAAAAPAGDGGETTAEVGAVDTPATGEDSLVAGAAERVPSDVDRVENDGQAAENPPPGLEPPHRDCSSATMLTVSAASVKRTSLSSRGASRHGGGGGSTRSLHTQFKMDETYDPEASSRLTPIVTATKAVKCVRPKEWSPQAEEAFRVQQTGWRDLKEYMETYGEPERWENGFIRCTRVKSNGYYTYWRTHRECDDKYLHSVKLFEYA